MFTDVTHDYNSNKEKREIIKWFEQNIGTEYEVNERDEEGQGHIVFYEVSPEDLKKLVRFLKNKKYI